MNVLCRIDPPWPLIKKFCLVRTRLRTADPVMHKLPITSYYLRKRPTKQKPSKSKPMSTLTPGSSYLQNTLTPSSISSPSPTSTSQNIQLLLFISTSPSVNPPNPPSTTLSPTHPEPAVALTSSAQNLNTALSTVDNFLVFEDQYKNEFLRHPPVETYVTIITNCNEPIALFPTSANPFPTHSNHYQCRTKSFRH